MAEDTKKNNNYEEHIQTLAKNTAKIVTVEQLDELEKVIKDAQKAKIDIDDYKRISMDIALRLEKIVATNRQTILFLNYVHIHPMKLGRAFKFRNECKNILGRIQKIREVMDS